MNNHILFNVFVSTKSSFGVRPAPRTRLGPTNYESLNYPIYNVLRETRRPMGKPKQRRQFLNYPDQK